MPRWRTGLGTLAVATLKPAELPAASTFLFISREMISSNLDEFLTAVGLVKSFDAIPSSSTTEIHRWAQNHYRDFYKAFYALSEEVSFYCFALEVPLRGSYCKMVLNEKSASKYMFSRNGVQLLKKSANLLEFYLKLKKASDVQWHGLPSTKFMDMYMDMTGR